MVAVFSFTLFGGLVTAGAIDDAVGAPPTADVVTALSFIVILFSPVPIGMACFAQRDFNLKAAI